MEVSSKMNFEKHNFCVLFLVTVCFFTASGRTTVRWCTVTNEEHLKCSDMAEFIRTDISGGYMNSRFIMECVQAASKIDCMRKIDAQEAQLVNLDAGLGYYASRYYTMTPLMTENYGTDDPDTEKAFYSVIAIRRGSRLNLNQLKSKRLCVPGLGWGAGWTLPVAKLIQDEILPITRCNVPTKSAAQFFGSMCAPGAMEEINNPFGINPTQTCTLCSGRSAAYCTDTDPFAGYDGALKCLEADPLDRMRLAFVKHFSVLDGYNANSTSGLSTDYELLCPDGRTRGVSEYARCNWGRMAANVIMSSAVPTLATRNEYKDFLRELVKLFSPSGNNPLTVATWEKYGRKDLLFSNEVSRLDDLGSDIKSIYDWLDSQGYSYQSRLDQLHTCPLRVVRWCVISEAEMRKCEDMILALGGKNLQPSLDCILGGSTQKCMELLRRGNSDMMKLESGDMFTAGKYYGLVPIAMEDYGISSMNENDNPAYYSVAVVLKENPDVTLFNLKFKRVCLPAVGSGTGWIYPVALFQETLQVNTKGCSVLHNIGEFLKRACIPGVLDPVYNPSGSYPVNLCEGCAAGSNNFCQRDTRENYYGVAGAFRCLVEGAGDIAFVDHPTPRENTDGRNQDEWARNRRSDDYELLCKDGSRGDLNSWRTCNLGRLPPDAVVTGGHKCQWEKQIYWDLLNFAQSYFASDTNSDFKMFDSGRDMSDLMFKDAAVRLRHVAPEKQHYKAYLPHVFRKYAEKNDLVACGNREPASPPRKNCPSDEGTSGSSVVRAAWTLVGALFLFLWGR